MKYTLKQAKARAVVFYKSRLIDHYVEAKDWGYCTISRVESGYAYEHKVSQSELVDICNATRQETMWMIKKKFGKRFGAKQYKELVKYVEGL